MITLIIAIVGAITGIVSLLIQFNEYRKSNVKLIVEIDDRKSFYTTGSKNYKCEFFGVISLKISNCSSLPITIDEVSISCESKTLRYFNKKIEVDKKHNYSENSYSEIKLYEQRELPLRIECYDTLFLSFIFPFWDDIGSKKFCFNIKTPRKNYKYFYKLNDFKRKFKEEFNEK